LATWVVCAALNAAISARIDEPLVLRLARRWAEHPIRVVAAGTLAAWAISGLVVGAPVAASPPKGRSRAG
jgi:hypothetical protein